jgi:hypothetical protein
MCTTCRKNGGSTSQAISRLLFGCYFPRPPLLEYRIKSYTISFVFCWKIYVRLRTCMPSHTRTVRALTYLIFFTEIVRVCTKLSTLWNTGCTIWLRQVLLNIRVYSSLLRCKSNKRICMHGNLESCSQSQIKYEHYWSNLCLKNRSSDSKHVDILHEHEPFCLHMVR